METAGYRASGLVESYSCCTAYASFAWMLKVPGSSGACTVTVALEPLPETDATLATMDTASLTLITLPFLLVPVAMVLLLAFLKFGCGYRIRTCVIRSE